MNTKSSSIKKENLTLKEAIYLINQSKIDKFLKQKIFKELETKVKKYEKI